MADRACVQRLQKEFRALCKEPVPHVLARPSPTDILEWHYVLEGSKNTPFEGGVYHGKVKFPPEYPYKPPGISMITPNGRFATQKRICMSMSDFHPETWNPMWSVSSILTGLLSFMMDNTPTTGSVSTSDEEKQRLAQNSLAFNCKSAVFRKMFPEYVEKHLERQRAAEQVVAEQANQNGVNVSCTLNSSGPQSDTLTPANNGHVERKGRQQKPSEKFPFWLTALVVAVFASIMALPLLTLDLTHS
jgi:ubiquitin-conjugating enzyme E2 J2